MKKCNNISTGQDLGLYSNVPAYWRNNLPNFIGIIEELNPETNTVEQKPIDVKTMGPASKDDKATWSWFDEVLKAKNSGLVQKVGIIPKKYKDDLIHPPQDPIFEYHQYQSGDGLPFGEGFSTLGYAEKSDDGLTMIELREGNCYGFRHGSVDKDWYRFTLNAGWFVALEGRAYRSCAPSQFGVPEETDSATVNLFDYLPRLVVGNANVCDNNCYSSTELSGLLNNLANAWGYRKRYTPSLVGKTLARLIDSDDYAKVGGFTVSREQRRVKKMCGDRGSQLQTVYLFIKTPPSAPEEQPTPATASINKEPDYIRNKIDHPLFEYKKHPMDVVDLDPYYIITPYRGCQFAGVAIERDPHTEEPIRKLYVDLNTGWGASADDEDTLSPLELAVWALNNSPKIEYIVCLPKSGDDLDKIEKINSRLCPIDIPVVSKPTLTEISRIDPMKKSYLGTISRDPDDVVGSIVEEILYKFPDHSIVNLETSDLTILLNEVPSPYEGFTYEEKWVEDMLSEAFRDSEHIIVHGITMQGMKISRSHATTGSENDSSLSTTYTFERLVTT